MDSQNSNSESEAALPKIPIPGPSDSAESIIDSEVSPLVSTISPSSPAISIDEDRIRCDSDITNKFNDDVDTSPTIIEHQKSDESPFLRHRTASENLLEQLENLNDLKKQDNNIESSIQNQSNMNQNKRIRDLSQIPTNSDNQLENALFVGHINTDLDSVAGAIGGAHLFNGVPTISEPKETLNGEIMFALKESGIEKIPEQFIHVKDYKEKNICLVDHTEQKQMVPEIIKDSGKLLHNVVGVIDHHALASSFSTDKPIYMELKPWGSMSSIITHLYIQKNKSIPKDIAQILMSAILSDTLNLKSPTTTENDKFCVVLLGMRCGFNTRDKIDEYALRMFKAKTEWIISLGSKKMCRADCKSFEVTVSSINNGNNSTLNFGIAVLEMAGSPQPIIENANDIAIELDKVKTEKGFRYCFLAVVDMLTQTSVIICNSEEEEGITKKAFDVESASPNLNEDSNPNRMSGIVGTNNIIANESDVNSNIKNLNQIIPHIIHIGNFASRKLQFMPRYTETIKKIVNGQ